MTAVATRRLTYTVHALERLAEMGAGRDEVAEAVDAPEVSVPEHRYPNRRRLTAGRVVVILEGDDLVITVLWRGDYERDCGTAPKTKEDTGRDRYTRRR